MTVELAPALLVIEVLDGAAAVCALIAEFDGLARRCQLPVTARGPWVRAQVEADPHTHPWAVLVRSGAGQLSAAAILLDRDDASHRRTVLAGGGHGYRAGVAAVDDAAARALGAALSREAARRTPGRDLDIGPICDDGVARTLAHALGAAIHACTPVPCVRKHHGSDLTAYLSPGLRKTLRKARNRMQADGVATSIGITTAPEEAAELLPVLEQAYRDRDREHGLPCLLDTATGRRLWRNRIHHLMAENSLELATLSIQGRVAAYALGVHDRHRYSVLEGRFFTPWARYAPGRLLEAWLLERALSDSRVTELDWMTGVAPESLLAANGAEPAIRLHRPASPRRDQPGAVSQAFSPGMV